MFAFARLYLPLASFLFLSLFTNAPARALPPLNSPIDTSEPTETAPTEEKQTPGADNTIYLSHIKNRTYSQGLAILAKKLIENPKSAELYLARGQILYSICSYRDAIGDFSKAASLDTTSAEPVVRRAIALCRIGNLLAAQESFLQALGILEKQAEPDAEMTSICARALLEIGQCLPVRDALKAIIDGKSDLHQNAMVRYLYAQALTGSGDKTAAMAQLNRALELDPNSYEANLARASLNLALNQQTRARTDAQKAVELNSKSMIGYYYLAQAYLNNNEVLKARDAINQSLIIAGKKPLPEAVALSAQIAIRQGDLARSAAEAALAVKLGLEGKSLGLMPLRQITTVDNVTGPLKTVIARPHFLIYGSINRERLEYYGNLAEAFITYVDDNLIKVKGNFPRALFIFPDKLSARAFLTDKMGFKNKVHGVYLTAQNAVVTYDGAGLGTIMHELMHTVLGEYKNLEFWAEEGIPCLFDRCYGYLIAEKDDRQSMKIALGFPEEWHAKWMGGKTRAQLTLADILKHAAHTNADFENEQRQLALLLCKQGKLKTYLSLIETANKKRAATYLEAALDKPAAKIEALFQEYMQALEKENDRIRQLPETEIFEGKAEFLKFQKEHETILQPFLLK